MAAVDEDHTTIQEQLEQDGTQEKQQQRKKEEEECEDSEEEEEVVVEKEEEDLEDIYMLLKPFTKKQLRDLSKHAIEEHPDLTEMLCRRTWMRARPVDPEVYWKEFKEMDHKKRDSNSPYEQLLEDFQAWNLEGFMRRCVNKFPDIAEYARDQADKNPAHRKILVWSYGFGWDATPESLTSEFVKYGEIDHCDCFPHKHSGKFICYAFISFKRWSGACNALEQPLKKIGNRMTVCKFAMSSSDPPCWYLLNKPEYAQVPSCSEPELRSWLGAAPLKQAGPVPEHCNEPPTNLNPQMRTHCCWSSHSLHGSLDHFLQMYTVGKMEEKPDAIMKAAVSYNPLVDPTVSKQFEWVCKSSSQLLENPPVMSMHHNNSTHTSLLLNHVNLLCLLSGEKFETRTPLDLPPPQFPKTNTMFRIMGSSVNGILGLCCVKNTAVLWNPITKEIKIVPPSLVEFESPYRIPDIHYHGFGYDCLRDDYKVIRYVNFYRPQHWPYYMENVSRKPLWEIYSLKSDSWKKLDYKMPPASLDSTRPKLCTGGVCHWLSEWNTSLVSFDMSKESFLKTPTPCDEPEMLLAEINGYVALISTDRAETTIEVSILDEFGVKGSWTKLFIIGPLPCIVNHFLGVGKEGEIFFYNEDGVAWFDVSTCMIVHLGLNRLCQIVSYKENFESLISRGFEKYDEDIVNVGQPGKIYESERGKCRKVQKEDSAAML